MPWGGASRRGGDNASWVVTHVFSPRVLTPPLTRTLSPPAGHDTGRALSLFFLNLLSTSRRHRRSQQHRTSPLHSAIGTPIISCARTQPASGQDGDDESGVDLSPRDGDLLFLTVRRGSHRTRPGSSYFSHTLNARYSRLACHEGGPEVNCT